MRGYDEGALEEGRSLRRHVSSNTSPTHVSSLHLTTLLSTLFSFPLISRSSLSPLPPLPPASQRASEPVNQPGSQGARQPVSQCTSFKDPKLAKELFHSFISGPADSHRWSMY